MFSRTKKDPQGTIARSARRGASFSVIGADAAIVGNLVTSENLQVNGRVEGDVRCGGLHQGPTGIIAGNIVAEEARLEGLVDGAVTAALLILSPSARVTGDVSYETLSIEGGARIDGWLRHQSIADAPAEAGQTVSRPPHLYPPQEMVQAAE